ncbi:hypothetical protein GQ53DRAFT_266911 [Thozetella sp. PMI_491]|nr:hypothetical protein GQ53DRAFT_266911 [Thozetella sp. PMI_491]
MSLGRPWGEGGRLAEAKALSSNRASLPRPHGKHGWSRPWPLKQPNTEASKPVLNRALAAGARVQDDRLCTTSPHAAQARLAGGFLAGPGTFWLSPNR